MKKRSEIGSCFAFVCRGMDARRRSSESTNLSVKLNDIRPINITKSTLVAVADDLSVSVKFYPSSYEISSKSSRKSDVSKTHVFVHQLIPRRITFLCGTVSNRFIFRGTVSVSLKRHVSSNRAPLKPWRWNAITNSPSKLGTITKICPTGEHNASGFDPITYNITKPINKGIPQGAILGPVLFFVMLNDIRPVNITKSTLVVFADDCKCHVRRSY